MKKILWLLFAFFCLLVGLYPITYFAFGQNYGLLSFKAPERLADIFWLANFYVHISCGGIALLVGWPQFSQKWRTARPAIHRLLGRTYVFTVLPGALTGIYIGLHAEGGPIGQTGFALVGAIWFYTTLRGFLHIRKGDVLSHQKMMIYSYAACFAAVMLRLWQPLLTAAFDGEYEPAYRTVAWLSWVPNLLVAHWMVRRLERRSQSSFALKTAQGTAQS